MISNLRANKTFKIIITILILFTFTILVTSCKEEAAVEEPAEKEPEQNIEGLVEEKDSSEKPAVEVEEEQKEEIPPEQTEETQAEFNESMIKNRLIVAKGAVHEYPWAIEGETLPLWYLREYGESEFIASGVVAGPLRRDIGDTGEEELLLQVAFQNPVTKKFYIRDISYGNNDFFSQLNSTGSFTHIPFEDYSFTVVTGSGGYGMFGGKFEKIEPNLIVGDQIAFIFRTALHPGAEKTPYPEAYKIYKDFMDVYTPNSISVLKAMMSNEDLPEVKLFAWTTMFNKAKDNN